MKSLAILTIFGAFNYGNRLQDHAMQSIASKMGFNTESLYSIKNAKTVIVKTRIRHLIKGFVRGSFGDLRRGLLFDKFNRKYVTLKECNNSNQNYDYYICGSDQIWNPEFAGKDFYFATFAPKEKRIAYAASFGVDKIPEAELERYTKNLNEMKAISVREDAGAKIVYELTGRKVKTVLDPTMLLTSEEWRSIENKPKYIKNDKFVLTYFLGKVSSQTRKYIEEECAKRGLKLINLEEMQHNEYWYATGPSEFVWLIEHSEAMFTDSFHGAVFSVLMNTPFTVFEREDTLGSMTSRIDTLLSTLELEDRKYVKGKNTDCFNADYSRAYINLEKAREESLEYLKKELEI
ncbi:MAG: polysaccharide pyruvyl transferase family protein [Monoglobales bacterium]